MNQQLPAYILNRAAPGRAIGAQASQGIASSQPARISIAGNRFTLIDSAGNSRPVMSQFLDPRTNQPVTVQAGELRFIVVGANPGPSKLFFEGAYDPNADGISPTCFSDNGTAPSTQASKPQSATCALCPHNAWGTRVVNGQATKGKACSDKKKLAVRLAPEYQDDIIYQLQVPPASLKDMSAYMQYICNQDFGGRKADVSDVITSISFEQGEVGKLNFTTVGFYDDATYNQIETILNTQADKIAFITGTTDQPRVAALPALQSPPLQITQQPAVVTTSPTFPATQVVYAPQPVAQPVYGPAPQQYAPQNQQPQEPVKTRKPRAGKGVVGTEQQAPVATVAPVVQPQAVPLTVPTAQPSGAPAFLQQQPAPNVVPAHPPSQQFGMVQNAPDVSQEIAAKIKAAMDL